jgi:hypothetical protein
MYPDQVLAPRISQGFFFLSESHYTSCFAEEKPVINCFKSFFLGYRSVLSLLGFYNEITIFGATTARSKRIAHLHICSIVAYSRWSIIVHSIVSRELLFGLV